MSHEDGAVPLVGPGDGLKAERIKQGISIDEISEQLRLAKNIVENLEANAFDELPTRVFVVGYLRSYARHLNMSEDDILNHYNVMCPRDDSEVLPSIVSDVKQEIHSNNRFVLFISWFLGIGLVALLAYWISMNLDIFIPEMSNEIVTEDQQKTPENMLNKLPEVIIPVKEIEVTSEEVNEPSVAKEMVKQEVVTETSIAETEPESAPEPEAKPAAINIETVEPVLTESVQEIKKELPISNEIRIKVKGQCWVDIRDSSRTFKLFGRMDAGVEEVLGGVPPYKVVLGDYRQVDILIAGKPYDLKKHAKGNVARFTLKP